MEISPFVIFFASIFTSNILLTNFLGMCSYLSISKDLKSALGLGEAVIFVMTATSVLNYLVYQYILVPFGLEYLRFIVFIIVIAAFVQLVEMILERFIPNLYYTLGIFLPLITVNCAILGVALFIVIREYNFLQSLPMAPEEALAGLLPYLLWQESGRKWMKARYQKVCRDQALQ